MTVRSLLSLAAAVGLGLATSSTYADQPAKKTPVVNNQKLADAVAARIGASGVAMGANVKVDVQSGVVELTGEVRSVKQAELIVQQALVVPGVVKVETYLALDGAGGIQPVQAAEPMPIMVPPVGPPGAPQDPVPLASPGMPSFDMTGPRMPPYAWPTYAPYNNFSRVAYPQAYPYNSFPFIGPYYPFPKVPLGWRSVKLEWTDGHWYLGRLSTPHDYWRVRFW